MTEGVMSCSVSPSRLFFANVCWFGSPEPASCINPAHLCGFIVFNLWAALYEIVKDTFVIWEGKLVKIPNL